MLETEQRSLSPRSDRSCLQELHCRADETLTSHLQPKVCLCLALALSTISFKPRLCAACAHSFALAGLPGHYRCKTTC
ncbi:uncharacterized protein B0I36DRAFT_267278 [Microdochium trichocladiopsis]|uniref:Uncharacterized protein n=1 Tax=Microdochium trichocladiopsis TaxID=1682393 RepID=A0A9P8Y5L3_9PEZI|nr:uncharacterized protein B0I36DRAFT_267278 [Microdochium trichocladiopsis]KAH7030761.1 hypothetical protein B0I36DRAFT_267278 [Microdochium trichocladiopsis]